MRNLILILLVTPFLLISCKVDEGPFFVDGPGAKYNSLEEFFDTNEQTAQNYTFDASAEYTITGQDGTKITLPANSFLASDTIYQGNIKASLKEYNTFKDMFYNFISTNTKTTSFIAAGAFEIDFTTADGQAIWPRTDSIMYMISIPQKMNTSAYNTEMRYYSGERQDDYFGDPTIWTKYSQDTVLWSSEHLSYEIERNSIDPFVSFGAEKESANMDKLQVTKKEPYSDVESNCWFLSTKEPTYVDLYKVESDRFVTEPYRLPRGTEGTVLLLSIVEGELYTSWNDIVMDQELKPQSLFVTPTKQEKIDSLLNTF